MLIRRRKGWELKESDVTPEELFFQRPSLNRRRLLGTLAGGVAAAALPPSAFVSPAYAEGGGEVAGGLYPAKQNALYTVDRPLTKPIDATSYNNFYEFGTSKRISDAAQKLTLKPWQVKIDGMVNKPMTMDAEDLIRRMPLEERLYRFRCVEAWSMTVPWTGFPLKALLALAEPKPEAKYIRMETFSRPEEAPGQRQFWYPWPYQEGLTVQEAANDLAFIATGIYGKPLPKQNGAPLRLATPWKYGFKSIKSIVRFEFTDKQPKTFWEGLQSSEYGFWANVNPAVSHPRWSQATEEVIGTGNRVPTLIYNGYGEYVADLYKGMDQKRLFM